MAAVSKFARYKRIFRNRLAPVFAMLLARRSAIAYSDWESLVRKTLGDAASNPTEFLGNDLPARNTIVDVLAEIEKEFLKDVRTFRR